MNPPTISGISSAEIAGPKRYSISAFFPAYNNAGSIGDIIHAGAQLLQALEADYEIVVVNDGSTDGTRALLDALAHGLPFLKIIHHETNQGYGAALITGFANCSKELIFYTDGDAQYDVNELSLLLQSFGDNIDIANGYKISRSDPKHRVILGWIYQHLMRLIFGLKIKDVDCDFRLFRRRCLEQVELTFDSGVICIELMKKLQTNGCRIVEVPVHHYRRPSGTSQFFRLKHLIRVFVQLFSAWWTLVIRQKITRLPIMIRAGRLAGRVTTIDD